MYGRQSIGSFEIMYPSANIIWLSDRVLQCIMGENGPHKLIWDAGLAVAINYNFTDREAKKHSGL